MIMRFNGWRAIHYVTWLCSNTATCMQLLKQNILQSTEISFFFFLCSFVLLHSFSARPSLSAVDLPYRCSNVCRTCAVCRTCVTCRTCSCVATCVVHVWRVVPVLQHATIITSCFARGRRQMLRRWDDILPAEMTRTYPFPVSTCRCQSVIQQRGRPEWYSSRLYIHRSAFKRQDTNNMLYINTLAKRQLSCASFRICNSIQFNSIALYIRQKPIGNIQTEKYKQNNLGIRKSIIQLYYSKHNNI